MIRNTFIATAITAAVALPAGAATISVLPYDDDGHYQAPENLVLDYLRPDSGRVNTQQRDLRSARNNAQSFVIPTATTIDKIAINYSDLHGTSDNSNTEVTFEFFRVADATAASLNVDGSIIDSVSFDRDDPAFGGNAAGTLIIDVADTVAAAGDAFAIRFLTDSSAGRHALKWEFHSNVPAGAVGKPYEANGNAPSGIDFYTIGIVEVPEPASLGLLGLGGLALLRRRRRGG